MTKVILGLSDDIKWMQQSCRDKVANPSLGLKRLLMVARIAFTDIAAWLGWYWWTTGRFIESTDARERSTFSYAFRPASGLAGGVQL